MAHQAITKRSLKVDEAKIFSKEIALTPNIIAYLPGELMRLKNTLIIENQTEIIGILAYVLASRFIDLKILIIREKYRDQGYGKALFDSFMKRVGTDRPIYTVTKNPAVIHLLKKAGFIQVGLARLPFAVLLHQSKMLFSLYRLKESIRKYLKYPHEPKFTYWIKYR